MHTQRLRGPAGNLAVVNTGTPARASDSLPVVLVHSLAGNSSHWSAQLAHIGSSRLGVALDLRGHGHSEPPRNRDYSIVGMATDVGAVVEALELERFLLVGHSMGGGAALAYAGSYPERIAGLVLVDPIGDGKQISPASVEPLLTGLDENYHSTIREYWNGITGTNPAVQERLLADLDATPRDTVVGSFPEALRFDPDPWLAAYQGPKLSIVTPFNDQSFSLHRLGKGFPHRMVHGTGHWIQLDKPAEINAVLDEFIEYVSGARTSVNRF